MSVLAYVVVSMGWSVFGFVLGWLAGSVRTEVHEIKEAVVPNTPVARMGRREISAAQATRILGVIMILLAIGTVISGVVAQRRIGDISECQASYNDRFAEVVHRRAQLGDEDRKALQDMLLALYRQREESDAERLRTFEEWVQTVERNEKERAQHPLPELPKGDCR